MHVAYNIGGVGAYVEAFPLMQIVFCVCAVVTGNARTTLQTLKSQLAGNLSNARDWHQKRWRNGEQEVELLPCRHASEVKELHCMFLPLPLPLSLSLPLPSSLSVPFSLTVCDFHPMQF